MDLMERVKAECEKHEKCDKCPFADVDGLCTIANYPENWNIEEIRKAFEETSDKASDKEEIVVPYKWSEYALEHYTCNVGYTTIKGIMIKQDKIIECLEQIKEKLK